MKRFFCTTCRKVKRVRVWPRILVNSHLTDITLRLGKCNRHLDKLNLSKGVK